MKLEISVEEFRKFWSYVQIGGPNDCWLWLGGKHDRAKWENKKYGWHCVPRFHAAFSLNGRTIAAARFVFQTTYKIIHAHEQICHTCDNTLCVNPVHLKLGTAKENMRDASAKGRIVNKYGSQTKTNFPGFNLELASRKYEDVNS